MRKIRKNTLGMFDCLKGIIVLWVILFHSFTEVWGVNLCTDYSLIWRVIYASSGVAMGTLFIISGYGFRPVKSKKAFKNQIKLLLKPWVIVYVCCIIIRIPINLLRGLPPFEGALERVLGFLLGKMGSMRIGNMETESIFVFWYFLALFISWMILSLIFYIFQSEKFRFIAVCICTILGYVLGVYFNGLPYCIIPSLLSVGFLYLGYILKKRGFLFFKIPLWKLGVLIIVSVVVVKFGAVNISTGYMKLGLLDYIGTLCAGFIVMKLYLALFNPENKLYMPFMFFGRNSFLFICIHGFEHLVAQWRSCPYLITDSVHITAFAFFIVRLLIIILIYYLILCINKITKNTHIRKAIC